MKYLNRLHWNTAMFKKILLSRYFITFVAFLIWLTFFDQHSFGKQIKLSQTLDHLKDEKVQIKKQIQQLKIDQWDFDRNKEKYAREKYLLHKENEQVYIIPEED